MLILLVKQRENVENAGRVNKRCERVCGETIPVDCDVTYLSKDSRRGSEDPAGRAVVSISPAVVFDLLK